MKTFLIIILVLFNTTFSYGQTVIYDTCNHLNAYEGEWLYTNGSETIRIYLRKARINDLTRVYDRLFGWYEYKQGAQTVFSDYSNRNMPLSTDAYIMHGASSIVLKLSECESSARILGGTLQDSLQANEIKIITATVNTAGTSMIWSGKHSEGYGLGTNAIGHTLPFNFTLIKQ